MTRAAHHPVGWPGPPHPLVPPRPLPAGGCSPWEAALRRGTSSAATARRDSGTRMAPGRDRAEAAAPHTEPRGAPTPAPAPAPLRCGACAGQEGAGCPAMIVRGRAAAWRLQPGSARGAPGVGNEGDPGELRGAAEAWVGGCGGPGSGPGYEEDVVLRDTLAGFVSALFEALLLGNTCQPQPPAKHRPDRHVATCACSPFLKKLRGVHSVECPRNSTLSSYT